MGAGAAALAASMPPSAGVQSSAPPPAKMPSFPPGFLWGVATSSYQIEGSPDADGKGKSIWDVYAHTPGKIEHGDTGDVAIDHYRRYKEDVALMKSMGVNAYRFSISWPRVFPAGTGAANPKGLDFYSRLVDELLAAGIEPFPTLYHWDLPEALQQKGGWQTADTSRAFADYAGHVARHLGDRVKHWFTLNEFQNFVDMGHHGVELTVQGKPVRIELAPGLKLPAQRVNQVAHHAVLAHGLSVQAIRASGRPGQLIGPAEVMFCAVPVIDRPRDVDAALRATQLFNARFLDVMQTGRYSDAYLERAGADAPKFTEADMRAIAAPIDFVGINVYVAKAFVVATDDKAGYREVPVSVSHPKMYSSWHTLSPEVLYWAPRLTNALWKPKAIYITENGCAAQDVLTADGQVFDTDRLMYLRNGLAQLQRATSEGVPVKGNFVWSAMDNFEWTAGYGNRFGLVYVDFATQKRTPKLSAAWFREAARRNAVV